jgi:zeaxanthin glucosyltransferase
MASIGILALAEAGHINATRRLQRELTEEGHSVFYILTESGAQTHVKLGVPFVRALAMSRRREALGAEQLAHADPSEWTLEFEGFQPDVVLVEATTPAYAMYAWRQHIDVLKLSLVFPQRYDPDVPPLGTQLRPNGEKGGSSEVREAWLCAERENARTADFRPLAQHLGFPLEWLDERSALGTTFRFPELALVPEQLDFPRRDREQLFYGGPCVELSRPEDDGSVALPVRTDRALVYCSFGSQLHRYPNLRRALETLVEAARSLPVLEFVVAAGISEFPGAPRNMHFVREAPQLAWLRRAQLMLSHGGLNGIKEALCLSVPLLVLPMDLDQPGNAARVSFHGLGRDAHWGSIRPADLAALIRGVMDDAEIRRKVEETSVAFLQAMRERRAARAFEACWAQYSTSVFSSGRRRSYQAAACTAT